MKKSPQKTKTLPPAPEKKNREWILFVLGIMVLSGIVLYTVTQKDETLKHDSGNLIVSEHPEPSELNISREQCAHCHADVFKNWSSSHHAWAQRKVAAGWDAPCFLKQRLTAHEDTLTFDYASTTEKAHPFFISSQKSSEKWIPSYAVGKTPLVQYLLLQPNGAYQCTSAAWDSIQKEWFDMFGQDSRTEKDWGHWKNRGMTWNAQCAWCHTSHFKKNYNTETHTYASTWEESGVSCIQCHKLHPKGHTEKNGCPVQKLEHFSNKQQNDNCASCHARREELDDNFQIGSAFEDHFVLNLPTQDGLWWPNGMQRDEVYTETGLKLSRMGHAGVQCLDCHQSHTAKPVENPEDNSLCLKCHKTGERKAPIIDPLAHSHHQANSEGNKCVNCHMPRETYMARDPRRDHAFTSPDPILSQELGIPNACLQCHKDKDLNWVTAETKKWYGDLPKTGTRDRARTRVVHHALKGTLDNPAALIEICRKEENATWRATLLTLLEDFISHPQFTETISELAHQSAKSTHSLERLAAARILGHHRTQAILDLLKDPAKTVRVQAAWALKDILPATHPAMIELETSAKHQADQPAGAMKLAQIYTNRAQLEEKNNQQTLAQDHYKTADYWYNKAIEWDPTSSVILRDYAIYLAGLNQQENARKQLEKAIALQPENAHYHYLLSLSYAEGKHYSEAISSLTKTVEIDPHYTQAYYNRALIYNEQNELSKAIDDLDKAHKSLPENPQFLYTKAILLYKANRTSDYNKAKAEALQIFPHYEPLQQLP